MNAYTTEELTEARRSLAVRRIKAFQIALAPIGRELTVADNS